MGYGGGGAKGLHSVASLHVHKSNMEWAGGVIDKTPVRVL